MFPVSPSWGSGSRKKVLLLGLPWRHGNLDGGQSGLPETLSQQISPLITKWFMVVFVQEKIAIIKCSKCCNDAFTLLTLRGIHSCIHLLVIACQNVGPQD